MQNDVLPLICFFIYHILWCCYFCISCISVSSLSCVCQRFSSKMKLVKTLLCTKLKQSKLENWFHILIESSEEGFNDIVFQHFVDELKHYNSYMWMDLELVSVFLCLYSIYLDVMLPFRMILIHNMFCFASFLLDLQYFSPLLQDTFVTFYENLLQSRNEREENRIPKEKQK